jgi:hypothetical protein
MSFLAITKTDLTAILTADGESVTYTNNGVQKAATSMVIHRVGDQGSAFINVPSALVTTPLFSDKVVDASGTTWYVSEVMQKCQDRTPCNLKHADYWKTLTLEKFSSGSWTTQQASVMALVETTASVEDFDEFAVLNTEYTITTTYIAAATGRMRFKTSGSRYYYINGITPDLSGSKTIQFACSENEA